MYLPVSLTKNKKLFQDSCTHQNHKLRIDVGTTCDRGAHAGRPHKVSYINSFLTLSSSNYKHISLYDIEEMGSTGHAVENLLHLVKGRGSLTRLKEIAKNQCPQAPIILAKFRQLNCPLRTYHSVTNSQGIAKIHMIFEEIVFGRELLSHIFNSFIGCFFGELAEELQKALDNKHIAPGDLVAFCQPVFQKITTMPIHVQFPNNEEKNLIVLKCRLPSKSKGSNFSQFDNNDNQPDLDTAIQDLSKDITILNNKLSNSDNFKILYFSYFTDEIDTLKRISSFVKTFGQINSLDSLFQQLNSNNGRKEWDSPQIVLSYFLKLVTSLQDHCLTAILFLKEILPDYNCGHFVKVILHNKFAEKICLAIKNENVVGGDIVVFVNPVVYQNLKFISKELFAEEPYVIEIGVRKMEEHLFICKLSNTSAIGNGKLDFRLTQDCSNCSMAKEVVLESSKLPFVEDSSRTRNQINSLVEHLSTTKTVTTTELVKHNRNTNLDDNFYVNFEKLVVTERQCSVSGAFPLIVTRPCSNDDFDYVSGYCSLSCHKMFMYSAVTWNVLKQALCPKCLVELRLVLCFELKALSQNGKHVIALFVDKHAERFLEISCKEFLKLEKARKLAKEVLKNKLLFNYEKIQSYSLKLSDVTEWRFL